MADRNRVVLKNWGYKCVSQGIEMCASRYSKVSLLFFNGAYNSICLLNGICTHCLSALMAAKEPSRHCIVTSLWYHIWQMISNKQARQHNTISFQTHLVEYRYTQSPRKLYWHNNSIGQIWLQGIQTTQITSKLDHTCLHFPGDLPVFICLRLKLDRLSSHPLEKVHRNSLQKWALQRNVKKIIQHSTFRININLKAIPFS